MTKNYYQKHKEEKHPKSIKIVLKKTNACKRCKKSRERYQNFTGE